MNIRQIDMVNGIIREHRNDSFYNVNKPNWCGCFIGNYGEWKYFLEKNKKDIKYGMRYEINLKNGERWTWLQEGKEPYGVDRFSRVIAPRRIDCSYMSLLLNTVGTYCTEIEWYGLPDGV